MKLSNDLSPTKPTVNDIARVAGVSLATVDRVLNARPGVRDVTIEKVHKAIAELGFVRDTAAANLARRRQYRLTFILPATDNEFVQALESEISAQFERLLHQRTRLDLRRVPPFDPQAMVQILDDLTAREADGVAIFGPETPSVRDAVNRANERGIAVATLVSDLPSSSRDHFVGIDNVAAGRTAALLMGRFVSSSGRILIVTGSRLARDHLERRAGFDAVMDNRFSDLDVAATIEGRDDPERISALLPAVFEKHPNIVGIYSSAAGNGGLIEFLESQASARDVVVIAHELTATSRKALTTGTFDALISQDSGHIIRSAIRVMKSAADKLPIDPKQERIRIDVYLSENLPPQ